MVPVENNSINQKSKPRLLLNRFLLVSYLVFRPDQLISTQTHHKSKLRDQPSTLQIFSSSSFSSFHLHCRSARDIKLLSFYSVLLSQNFRQTPKPEHMQCVCGMLSDCFKQLKSFPVARIIQSSLLALMLSYDLTNPKAIFNAVITFQRPQYHPERIP